MSKIALRVYIHEIETLVDQGPIDEAIAHCQHILKTFPKHLETYRMLGKAYLEAQRHSDAADIFQRVLTAVPDDFVAHLGMSIIQDEQKNLDQAIWHMERAYEANPSNGGVQAELRRLYGRRDGLEPPKIQLTRGALARMYIRGRQYEQAITEIKTVLLEDSERVDLKVLLAQAYFQSGQKVEATEICTEILQVSPYSFDANRILVEILPGTSLASNVETYKKRLQQLDPYIGMVIGSIFDVASVQDSAVTIERLEWDPSVGFEAADRPAESESAQPLPGQEIPEWMQGSGWGPSSGEFQEGPVDFDEPAAQDTGELAAAEIPDWLKAMAPPGSADETPQSGEGGEESADLDWLSGIGAPVAGEQAETPAAEQPAADWLTDMGAEGETPAETTQPVAEQPAADDVPDWLTGLGAEAETPAETPAETTQPAAEQPAADDVPDWLTGLGAEAETPAETVQPVAEQPAADDVPDWLTGLGAEGETPAETAQTVAEQPAADDAADWLAGLGTEDETPAETVQPAAEQPVADDAADWLTGLGTEDETPAETAQPAAEQPVADDAADWLTGLGAEAETPAETAQPAAEQPAADDAADWLTGLGAEAETPAETAQPAAEQPAADDVPDWLADVGAEEKEPTTFDNTSAWLASLGGDEETPAETAQPGLTQPPDQPAEPVAEQPAAQPAPVPGLDDLPEQEQPQVEDLSALISGPGTSQSEQDDAFKWLESLAAGQGAKPEELLTQPEERLDHSPDWVASVDETSAAPVASEPAQFVPESPLEMEDEEPLGELSAPVSGPGTSELDQDDAFKWLESLAAGQGAKSEELLTQPEERLEQAPGWVGDVENPPPPLSALVSAPGTSELEQDDSFKWLEGLAADQGAKPEELLTQPEERLDHSPDWLSEASGQPESLAEAPEQQPLAEEPLASAAPEEPPHEQALPAPAEVESAETLPDDEDQPPQGELSSLVAGPGTSESEQDDAFKWLESLAADQGAKPEELLTQPEERLEQSPDWVAEVVDQPVEEQPPAAEEPPASAAPEEPGPGEAVAEPSLTEPILDWFAEQEPEPAQPVPSESDTEPSRPVGFASEEVEVSDWLQSLDEEESPAPAETGQPEAEESFPEWLKDEAADELSPQPQPSLAWIPADETLPGLEADTDSASAESPLSETSEQAPAESAPQPVAAEESVSAPETVPAPPSAVEEPVPASSPRPTVRQTGILGGDKEAMLLQRSRLLLEKSNLESAMTEYARLIKKGKYMEEIIFDLQEATYQHPVDVVVWQTLGDAYMRSNRLQEALDAYTKAEELLR